MLNYYTLKNIKPFNKKKYIETNKLIRNLFLFSIFSMNILISPELFATDGGVLAAQTNSIFSFFKGQAAGILIVIGIVYSVGMTLLSSSPKHLIVGGVAVVFLFVMKGWAETTYSVLI